MNRLVLIGNGFDLAHGFKTSYQDFINWYWDERLHNIILVHEATSADILCSLEVLPESEFKDWYSLAYHYSFFKNPSRTEWAITGKEFIEFLKSEPNRFKVTYSPFFERIIKSIETKNWVDIENEYYELLVLLHSHVKDNYLNLNKQMDFLRDKLIEYLKTTSIQGITPLKPIKDKIYGPIKTQEIAIENLNYSGNKIGNVTPTHIMLLSFNYTKTPELYMSNELDITINYIHGCLDEPKSVIFGYGDELDERYHKLSNQKDNEALRHIKSIRYLESDRYRKVLQFIESGPFQIVIMGHSCGNSDRTLLNTLFEHKNCVSIKPYYHQINKDEDNYIEIVQNISRNFKDMKLMRDRVVNKVYCEPLTTGS